MEDQRAEAERELAEQRAQDEALQAYLDQMSQLMLEKNLSDAEEGSPGRVLAQARTLAVLESLEDPQRKRAVLRFLLQSKLILNEDPVVRLAHADLTEIELYDVGAGLSFDLPNANLDRAYLTESQLTGVHFDHAYLRGTGLEGARLWGASFVGADLTEARLGSTADTYSLGGRLKEFPAADLSGANLSDATLTNAYMYDVDMSPLEPNTSDPGALRDEGRTNLSDANLRYAFMEKADLRNTILNGADFTCANLAGADFRGATGTKPKQLENQARNLSEATMPGGTKYVQQQPTLRSSPGPEIGATMPDGNIRARILERCIRPDGTISAGPYTTEQFEPALSFNVGDGWRVPYAVTTDALSIDDLEGNELNFNNRSVGSSGAKTYARTPRRAVFVHLRGIS
ncbi:MAG: pentapeptide repeat-containing protein [Rubrobacteraceae bacterium]|nr:pentapeptide repeat-containing protein [Rubrobacteraceae bacterium]